MTTTSTPSFDSIRHLLSGKPLRRPNRAQPLSREDADDLAAMEAAKREGPPQDYMEFRREFGLSSLDVSDS